MANSRLWTKAETCPGPRLCNEFEFSERARKAIKTDEDRSRWVKQYCESRGRFHGYDEDGFYWCGYCYRIRRDALVECPDCGKFFKGPRPNFRIDYECENCE